MRMHTMHFRQKKIKMTNLNFRAENVEKIKMSAHSTIKYTNSDCYNWAKNYIIA